MFIDESIGERKITVVIIKMVLKKNGVRTNTYTIAATGK